MQPFYLMVFLIGFPLLLAIASLVVRPLSVRRIVAAPANALIAGGTILLLAFAGSDHLFFKVENSIIEPFMVTAEVGMGLLIVYLGLSSKRYFIVLLGAVMTAMTFVFEVITPPTAHAVHHLFVDRFSVIMALVIGILGTLIINYAIGYMEEYHEHHKEVKDRRRFFGFLMYLFISSMFGLVFSNSLKWMFFFWEITTLCSFFLIGYRNDKESQDSAFRALWMNVLGGIAFSAGVAYLSLHAGILDLDRMILAGSPEVMIPAVLLAFAGLVKSAQMPFSSWLTGAMVAPTPVSALLHSSTMVKAGVYLLLKVSPILNGSSGRYLHYLHWRRHVPVRFVHRSVAERRQARPCLLHHRHAGVDRHVCRSRDIQRGLVCPPAHYLSRRGKVPALFVRGCGGLQTPQQGHRRHGFSHREDAEGCGDDEHRASPACSWPPSEWSSAKRSPSKRWSTSIRSSGSLLPSVEELPRFSMPNGWEKP